MMYNHFTGTNTEPGTASTAKEDKKALLLQEIGRLQMDNHNLKNRLTSIRFGVESVKSNRNTYDEIIAFYIGVPTKYL